MRLFVTIALIVVAAACAPSPSPSPWGTAVLTPAPETVANQPVLSRTADTITVAPISPTGAVVGVDYTFLMPHCGIRSPIDVDGSFWDPVGVLADNVAFDGTQGTFRLLNPQTATFTGSTGLVLRLTRHQGAKAFGFCA